MIYSFKRNTPQSLVRHAVRVAEADEKNWNHWASLFHCVCMPVNDLAISLVKDAIDLLKESKHWRMGVKRYSKLAWKRGEEYESLVMDVSKHNDYGDRRQFVMDYMDSWQDSIKKDIIVFRECISSYLLKQGISGNENVIQSAVLLSYVILDYSVHLWDLFWELSRERNKKDYSLLFRPSRLTGMLRQWYEVVSVFDPDRKLHLDDDENCANAFKIIERKCTSSELANKAGSEALDLNEDVRECVRRLEEEEQIINESK